MFRKLRGLYFRLESKRVESPFITKYLPSGIEIYEHGSLVGVWSKD